MTSDYFFSRSTGLYVSRKPLKIDSRVKIAAEKIGIIVKWDDEGRINYIDFDESKKLLESLGARMLSQSEYWEVYKDAEEEKDLEMIESLTSNEFCEWLDRVYLPDGKYIEHPEILGKYQYSGEKIISNHCIGRPGWFNPENIDNKQGNPIKVKISREKFESSWKYWSPDFSVTKLKALAPIRGYVTSVGKPSLDLGIPVDARQPVQMIRECREKPLESPIEPKILEQALAVIKEYSKKKKDVEKCISFIKMHGAKFKKSKEIKIVGIREKLIDTLGSLRIDLLSLDKPGINEVALNLVDLNNNEINYSSLLEFVKSSRDRLSNAIAKKEDIVFVMGHKNPDSDTVVSALFEAWRNHLSENSGTNYIPVVQSLRIPDEIRKLLGDEIASSIVRYNEKDYVKAKNSGLARWISTDQNREPEVQRYFISIIDHHSICDIAKKQEMPKTIEVMGSCTALIVQKMLGMGIPLDVGIARILYGATLMDTENRVAHKMTKKDAIIMDYLKYLSKIEDESKFYSELMSSLLNTDDPDRLFNRDYKEDWGFGFAVAKIKHGFDGNGRILKPELFTKAVNLARKNNLKKNFPLTILRITDYNEDNIVINRERIYLIFNKNSSREYKKAITNLLINIIKFEFGDVNIKQDKEYIEFWGSGMQLSRKKTAPILEPVVKAFHEYFYSPSNKFWVKRDFLRLSSDVKKSASLLGMKLFFDKENRINWISYPEAKKLVDKLGFFMLSLAEYWKTLYDAKKINDTRMIESLQGSNFVEFLDSAILDSSILIEHPSIVLKGESYTLTGNRKKVDIPEMHPGLVHPDSIDLETGIPREVRNPSEYGNPELWRYWAPDVDIVIPARSYIFLLKQPCWDGKFHINDVFPNLGIRVCCEKVPIPLIEVRYDNKHLSIKIIKEGDTHVFQWAKGEIHGAD